MHLSFEFYHISIAKLGTCLFANSTCTGSVVASPVLCLWHVPAEVACCRGTSMNERLVRLRWSGKTVPFFMLSYIR